MSMSAEFTCPHGCHFEKHDDLLERIAALEAQLAAHTEAEAAVCPEDVGCIEYIKTLQQQLAAVTADLRAVWGD